MFTLPTRRCSDSSGAARLSTGSNLFEYPQVGDQNSSSTRSGDRATDSPKFPSVNTSGSDCGAGSSRHSWQWAQRGREASALVLSIRFLVLHAGQRTLTVDISASLTVCRGGRPRGRAAEPSARHARDEPRDGLAQVAHVAQGLFVVCDLPLLP